MSTVKRILYIQPFEFFGVKNLLTECFIRISNYLNSRKSEIEGEIEEEYLDLRLEKLPEYFPENIENYRIDLKELLESLYKRFNFDVVAISCYTSFTYLNSVEVAWMIKHYINPQCHIIVGGFHPSVVPKDFYRKKIPSYFKKYYPKRKTLFDYLVIDEGEIPFFHFIKSVLNGTLTTRKNLRKQPIILGPEIMKNLEDLPIIDLDLFKRYNNHINKRGDFYISFNRGCPFKCKFCPTSENDMCSYQMVRFKSIDKCIAELKRIINTKWLSIENLKINDPIFFSRISQRRQFFNKLIKLHDNNHKIPFKIIVFDRIDICSREDLESYKRLDIIPGFGLETGSSTLLCRLGKFIGKNNNIQKANEYLERAEELIMQANNLNMPIIFLCMGAAPGSDKDTIKENSEFFFGKRFFGNSLIEKYKVNLQFEKFALFPGTTFYKKGEKMFGAKYYYKKWWKKFDKDQAMYCAMVRPSKHFSFTKSMKFLKDFLKKLYISQRGLDNEFYEFKKQLRRYILYKLLIKTYKDTRKRYKLLRFFKQIFFLKTL